VSCLRNSPHDSRLVPLKNLPFSSFAKRVEFLRRKFSLFQKKEKGGFECASALDGLEFSMSFGAITPKLDAFNFVTRNSFSTP
jgi:hypothetical protein